MSRDTGFAPRGGTLHAEGVALTRIAQGVGTPTYVYSANALRAAASRFREALSPIPRKSLAFAVKANPSLAVLSVLRDEGFGADIVSGGELTAALAAGIGAGDIVYSGVGKTPEELARALRAGVGHINLEGSAKARRWRRPPSAWAGRDRAAAGQSRCRCGHPCQDHDRNRRQQIRGADGGCDRHL